MCQLQRFSNSSSNNYELLFEQNEPFSNNLNHFRTKYEQIMNGYWNNFLTVFQIIMDYFSSKMNNFRTFCRTIFKQFVEQYSNSLSNNFRKVLWTQILSVFRAHVSDLSKAADPKLGPARTATYFSSRLKVPFKPNLRLLRFSFCVRQLQLNGW